MNRRELIQYSIGAAAALPFINPLKALAASPLAEPLAATPLASPDNVECWNFQWMEVHPTSFAPVMAEWRFPLSKAGGQKIPEQWRKAFKENRSRGSDIYEMVPTREAATLLPIITYNRLGAIKDAEENNKFLKVSYHIRDESPNGLVAGYSTVSPEEFEDFSIGRFAPSDVLIMRHENHVSWERRSELMELYDVQNECHKVTYNTHSVFY